MKRKQSEDVATPTICWSLALHSPRISSAQQFINFQFFPCLYLTVKLIDVNGLLLQPGRLSNQTAKRRLYRHIEAYRLPLLPLAACRFGNFIKDASKVGGNLAAFVFLVAAFGLPLPAGGVACQPQTPPTPQNQSGMEKQRTFHTPTGSPYATSPKLQPTRQSVSAANRPHFQFIK